MQRYRIDIVNDVYCFFA